MNEATRQFLIRWLMVDAGAALLLVWGLVNIYMPFFVLASTHPVYVIGLFMAILSLSIPMLADCARTPAAAANASAATTTVNFFMICSLADANGISLRA